MALDRIAALLSGGEASAVRVPWHLLDDRRIAVLRRDLASLYAPTTANRMLAALRGVLKEAWRLGIMDAERYQHAAAVENVPWFITPRGRTLTSDEIQALFAACSRDGTPAGVRDTALLTVLFAGGLRRSEVVALDVRDYDAARGALSVRGTQHNRERTLYTGTGAAQALDRWMMVRGTASGPLFVPVNRGQKILLREQRMTDQSIHRVLLKRGAQAGVAAFSSHDLRRTFIARLLDTGVDLATVQHLAGHVSVATTQRYDRRGEDSRREMTGMLEVPGHTAH